MLGSTPSAVQGRKRVRRAVTGSPAARPSHAYGLKRKTPGGLGDWSPIQKTLLAKRGPQLYLTRLSFTYPAHPKLNVTLNQYTLARCK